MKKLIILALWSLSLNIFAQNAKYDGDWYATFEGIGAADIYDEPQWGTGKWVYRIRTVEDKTTIRVKVRYPRKNDYEYWNCVMTSCDASSLTWYSETSNYWIPEESRRSVVTYYCSLRYDSGTLQAKTYYVQRFYNSNGTLIKSSTYGQESFTLYKDGDDW